MKVNSEIENLLVVISEDLAKLDDDKHGCKAAAARIRKNSLALAKLFKEFRKESCAYYATYCTADK